MNARDRSWRHCDTCWENQGWFASIYGDRAGHFFQTSGGPVDPAQLTQVGRAMRDLGIRMIPAYSPQARGRSERSRISLPKDDLLRPLEATSGRAFGITPVLLQPRFIMLTSLCH